VTALSDAPAREPTQSSPLPEPRSRLLMAAGIVVLVGGLFFYFYTRSNLWLDEALSVNIARLPLSDLHEALRHDGAPPLYYVLLHFWTAAFGTSGVAARSMSGVFMLGATVAIWFAARRLGGRQLAWLTAMIMLANPYAIRYATETRMYALEILLVACGIVAFQRVVDRPTYPRAAVFGLLVALALYTQYWSFYLLPVIGVVLVWMIWRNRDRDAARYLLVAAGVGILAFLPWLPTFLYQGIHTGTPWGTPILPALPFGYTIRDFAGGANYGIEVQEGWLLFLTLCPLLLLGVFGRGLDNRRIEVDVVPQREVHLIAFVGGVGLAVALSLNYLAGGAFQSRYSAFVFPFFVLLVARGFTTLRDPRVLAGAAVLTVLLGFGGGVRNVLTQRTQAGEVAAILRRDARPGDLVVYCPDQIGPAVDRLAPKGLDEVVYPSFAGPERVDWVDYKKRLKRANFRVFARTVLERAGSRTLWYVSAPGYITHKNVCEAIGNVLAASRDRVSRTLPDPKIFEKPSLDEFLPRPPSS
jgi:mannosyltransferase